MSDTMTLPEQEVEFVLWEAEDPFEHPCEATRKECPNVALYRFYWVPCSDKTVTDVWGVCRCGSQDLCLGCKDWVLGQSISGVKAYRCGNCDGSAELKRVEPISRG
jgi:hypothetical protein